MTKRFTIDVEETHDENAWFDNGEFVCFEDDFDELLKKMNELADEKEQIKHTIKEAYETERTSLGKSVLKQLLEAIQ